MKHSPRAVPSCDANSRVVLLSTGQTILIHRGTSKKNYYGSFSDKDAGIRLTLGPNCGSYQQVKENLEWQY